MTASTIDEVIERLDTIIRDSIATRSRLGYFAALYNRVTRTVRDGIQSGQFEDGARMEALDVLFAGRYLDAHDRYRAGQLPSRSWLAAFEAAERTDVSVLQHLLLGVNAHINLDLGVAVARLSGADLALIKPDFEEINGVLSSLVAAVETENEEIAPVIAGLVGVACGQERKVASVFLAGIRDAAWRFAEHLGPLDLVAQVGAMARRDLEVAAIAEGLAHESICAKLLDLGAKEDVAANIAVLAEGELSVPEASLCSAEPAGAKMSV
jgi:Family of unknown function (DUF5995)